MKLKFKIQQFQTDAVNAVVDCFAGQPNEQSFFTLEQGYFFQTPSFDFTESVTFVFMR